MKSIGIPATQRDQIKDHIDRAAEELRSQIGAGSITVIATVSNNTQPYWPEGGSPDENSAGELFTATRYNSPPPNTIHQGSETAARLIRAALREGDMSIQQLQRMVSETIELLAEGQQ